MDNKYNLNGIFKLFSRSGEETLSVSLFQGSASFVMFKKGSDSKRPVAKLPLSLPACISISDVLNKLLEAQPDTRIPVVQLLYNKESRTSETIASFVFFKDDRRCYGIEVSGKDLPTPVKFYFRCPSTFSTGSEPMSDEQKSQLGVREFKLVLTEQIPTALLLSRLNMEPMMNRGGSGGGRPGGNSYSRPSNGGGSRDPYGSTGNSGGSEEESIFG